MASAAPSIAAIPEEVLTRTLTFLDRRGLAAATFTRRRWCDIIRTEGFWRAALKAQYPRVEAAAWRVVIAEGGWRELLLYTERLATLADARLKGGLAQVVEDVRTGAELLRLDCYGRNSQVRPYPSPTEGTTATETPDASGVYSKPVYYDWGANWERVKELVLTPAVQAVVESCVNEASPDGYYFDSWDVEEKVWPLFHRCGEERQIQLMRLFLPTEHVREFNGLYADWFRSEGEALLAGRDNPKEFAECWVADSLEMGDDMSDEEFANSIEETRGDIAQALYNEVDGTDLMAKITKASEKVLYHKDGPLRETLLCNSGNAGAFLPLNYLLAKLVSPEDAELRVYSGDYYSVVVDERRNILFDNCWYFDGRSASVALECCSREPLVEIEPQRPVPPFSIFQNEMRPIV